MCDDDDVIADKTTLYVRRALRKEERLIQLRKEHEELKMRLRKKNKNMNVYVKNLPKDFTEEKLEKLFSKFGKVSNVKVRTRAHARTFN